MLYNNNALKLSLLSLSFFASSVANANDQTSKPEYIEIMNQTARLIEERISELNRMAVDDRILLTAEEANFDESRRPIFSNDKYLSINGIAYPITTENTVSAPLVHWSDDSGMRNMFNFLGDDWELSWYEGGVVFVNKKFGNYNYGNGCLLEYYPRAASIPDEYINRDFGLVRELESCFDGSMGDTPDFEANRFNPHHFGVHAQYANFVAIESYQDLLIAAHSPRSEYGEIANPVIGFYNPKTQEREIINGIGRGRPYQQISDIEVHANKLYVAATSQHGRIDVFNLDDKEYLYSFAITAKADAKIKVTDAFIFVTDKDKIFVYQNVETDKHNVLEQTPYAVLSDVNVDNIELINDTTLLGVSNSNYYIFDIANLPHLGSRQASFIGNKGFGAIDLKDNKLVTKQDGRMAIYDIDRFVNDAYVFKEAANAVYLLDGHEIHANDFLITEDGIVTLSDSVISLIHSMKDVSFEPNVSVAKNTLTFDALPESARIERILLNDSNVSVLSITTNTSTLVQARLLDGDRVEIGNYTEVDLTDVSFDVTAQGQNNWVHLTEIDYLPAYTRIILPLTALNADKRFNTVNGSGVFDYTKMLSTMKGNLGTYGNQGTLDVFSSRYKTNTRHPLFEKLNQIKANWEIEFLDKTILTDKEADWTQANAKKHIELLTNFAYVVSSERFKEKLMNFKAEYGHDLQISSEVLNTQEAYANFLAVTLKENNFYNVAKLHGYQRSFGITGQRGSTFGASAEELKIVAEGDFDALGFALAKQLVSNYFLDCMPKPCNWNETHLQKLIVDVYIELNRADELPYNM